MKRIILGIILAFAGSAFAGNNNNDGCQGNCPSSGGGTATATVGNISATGGAGGQGGSVIGSGNSANTNINNNTVKSYNDIRNTNINTNVSSNKQGQGQLQGQGQSQSNSAVGSGNSTNVTVESTKQPVSGPGIASSPSATCRIAVGLSVGGTFGGVGGFGSVEDANCVRNEKIRMLTEVLKRPDAAFKLACKDADMAEAMGNCDAQKSAEAVTPAVASTTRTSYDPFSTAPQQR